jgi:hypothetical protein
MGTSTFRHHALTLFDEAPTVCCATVPQTTISGAKREAGDSERRRPALSPHL